MSMKPPSPLGLITPCFQSFRPWADASPVPTSTNTAASAALFPTIDMQKPPTCDLCAAAIIGGLTWEGNVSEAAPLWLRHRPRPADATCADLAAPPTTALDVAAGGFRLDARRPRLLQFIRQRFSIDHGRYLPPLDRV